MPAGYAAVRSGFKWEAADHLVRLSNQLYRVETGQIDRLMVNMPPRHGKTELSSVYYSAYHLERHPDEWVMLCSYGLEYAASIGRRVREIISSELSTVELAQDSSAAHRFNIQGHKGGMICAGIGGPITGRGANVLIIDDPVKTYEEALSATYQERNYQWYDSTARPRLEPGGKVIVTMTRWHQNDLCGKLLAATEAGADKWEHLCFKALSDEGKPLWPTRYTADALMRIKANQTPFWWSAMYQQEPLSGAQLIDRSWFRFVDFSAMPRMNSRVRYWDMAAKKESKTESGDYAAGALLCRDVTGQFGILDMIRVRLTAKGIEDFMLKVAARDGVNCPIWFEADGGGTGEIAAKYLANKLAGYDVHYEHPTGSKTTRANPFVAQAAAGNVWILNAPWNKGYLDRLVEFPYGEHDDEMDATSGAFSRLLTIGERNDGKTGVTFL